MGVKRNNALTFARALYLNSIIPDPINPSRVWDCHPLISTSLRNGMLSYPIINTNLLMDIHVLPLQICYSYSCDDGSSVYCGCKMFCHMQYAAVSLVCFPVSSFRGVTINDKVSETLYIRSYHSLF